jgi:hypothetical protein
MFFAEYGSLKPHKREGAADLDQAVFMSDVSRKDAKGFNKMGQQEGDGEGNVSHFYLSLFIPSLHYIVDSPSLMIISRLSAFGVKGA